MINRQDTFENEWVLSGVQEARDLEEGGAQEREEGKQDKVVNENPKPLKLPSNLNGNLSMPELEMVDAGWATWKSTTHRS